jgi:hypothetical protein
MLFSYTEIWIYVHFIESTMAYNSKILFSTNAY